MSAYKSFAVVGGGTIGLPIVIDFTDASALAAVFKQHNVDVVLSTITTTAAAAQKPLVDAAGLAAVKLFVPSEYGMPTDVPAEGPLGAKNQIAADLKAAGIPSTRFFVGIFTEFIPWLVGYANHGKIRIVGKGEVPVSFTSIGDIAGFVAYVLTTFPPSELENRIFRLEGDRASLNDLGAQFKTSVEHVDSITGEAGELKTILLTIVETGAGSTGWDATAKTEGSGSKAAGSANSLWPGHQWQTIKEVYNL
ncbi:hypothetical protein FB451DRAFT_1279191 [Mycena latifolia]|nr:hypothetical protein FB451DRAFT_1279191 [Mycena latifolia]